MCRIKPLFDHQNHLGLQRDRNRHHRHWMKVHHHCLPLIRPAHLPHHLEQGGQQLVLLRPLRGVMSKIRDLSGVALLAGGEVGMVLAVNRLLAA